MYRRCVGDKQTDNINEMTVLSFKASTAILAQVYFAPQQL